MAASAQDQDRGQAGSVGLESTASLLRRVSSGDHEARERLVARYLPALRRWAHGRLPAPARDMLDTDDLVQVTLLKALDQVDAFEPRKEGAFLAYLRRVLLNQLRDELRRVRRRPGREELPEELLDRSPSPLEHAIGAESLRAYEAALATLASEQQEALIMRIEMGFTYREVAEALGSPSEDAARMLVARALVRLAEAMNARR